MTTVLAVRLGTSCIMISSAMNAISNVQHAPILRAYLERESSYYQAKTESVNHLI